MTKTELKKIRTKLPKNGSSLIKEKASFSIAYINMVLAGTKFNQKIIDAAIEIAFKHQSDLKEKSDLIKAL